MKPIILVAIALWTTAGCSDSSQSEPWHKDYAKKAISQNIENEEFECNFTSARWHSSFERHYTWSKTVTKEISEGEIKVRETGLKVCKLAKDYAAKAVDANSQNTALGCNYQGRRWHSDLNSHFQWAKFQSEYILEDETKNRLKALSMCKSRSSEK